MRRKTCEQIEVRSSLSRQACNEILKRLIPIGPVQPRRRIILAISVVVAALGAPKFVAGGKHDRARRSEQGP